MMRRWALLVAVLATLLGTARSASAAEEMKLGTLAPADSAWGKVFKAWAKAVDQESQGAVKLTWYFNGTQGDEAAMVGKMRSKQIDGGALTATGLSAIYPHVIALQLPGLFPNWAKLDAVREKTRGRFDAAFESQGFKMLGTGDVGIAHLMSKGKAVRTPDDLKSMKPFCITGDVICQKMLEIVGVSSPKQLGVPSILPSLSNGSVDVINSPSIAATQLQWASQVDHINAMASGIGIGALIVNKERFDALPADVKALLERTGKVTGQQLTERIRKIDDDAFKDLKGRMTVVEPNEAEKQAWQSTFKKVREALKTEGKVKADVVDEVTQAAQ